MFKRKVKRTTRKAVVRTRGTTKRILKPRFKVAEFVYSGLNPTEKRQIKEVKSFKTPGLKPKYRLVLSTPAGKPKLSRWIEESSLSRRKKR